MSQTADRVRACPPQSLRRVAELDVIRERHGDEFELIGEPEVRELREWVGFNPYPKPGEQ